MSLKNVPPKLIAALRRRAKAERRSLNQQVLLALQDSQRAAPPDRVEAQVAAWRELCGAWRSDLSLEEEIAAIRRRRTRGRKVSL